MTLHLHHLTGCAPAPLASYLKALGILRLVSEQADAAARGWWQDEHFCLLTTMDRDGLEAFFLDRYRPTPLVSPWNKGSGFYVADDKGLSPIERSTAERFQIFRDGIAAARLPLEDLQRADAQVRQIKDRAKMKKGMSPQEKEVAQSLKDDPAYRQEQAIAERMFKGLKADLFSPCLRSWRGPHREWMDTALVLPEEGKPSFPSLLGTGGNDGRLDFTNNAMQRLGELFELSDGTPQPETASQWRHAVWNTPCHSMSAKAAIGQFLPGGAGGANSTSGPDGDSLINPWDFILMLEGSVVIQSRTTRRLDPLAQALASAPFAMHAQASGHASPGSEKAERGEQWMPVWTAPSRMDELRTLFGEARLQLGRKPAHRPVDAARAIARLGSARGIESFTRFGYLERNGQSNLAVPLGRIRVQAHAHVHLIDDLAPWMDKLQREARGKFAPSRLIQAERRLVDAVLAALAHDPSADRWQAILLAAHAIEALQAHGAALKAGPIPRLRPEWVGACDDGSSEWRLAVALGSAAAAYGPTFSKDPIRHHWLPLKFDRFVLSDKRLQRDPRVVMGGQDLLADACAVVDRRLIDASRKGQRHLPLIAAAGCAAQPADLRRFVTGHTDDARLLGLGLAAMAIDWPRWDRTLAPCVMTGPAPDDAWWVLRLATLPWSIRDGQVVPVDPAIPRRLASGDGATAFALARQRLTAHGLHPVTRGVLLDAPSARRWAAALVFPITRVAAQRAADHIQPQTSGVTHA